MGLHKGFWTFWVLVLPNFLIAEPTAPSSPSSPIKNTIPAFDDKIFTTPEKPAEKAAAPGSRYSGDEPDYTSVQRSEWIAKCSQFRDKDPKAYRECFAAEKAKTAQGLREARERVERRQLEPLRNTSPVVPDIENRESAFGGVDSKSEND